MSGGARLSSFAPVATADARVLVLGSMPGEASLAATRYYAHPQNRFWPIMGALVGATPALPYEQRLQRLLDAGIALWDVLASCERVGSLDTAIRAPQANDFAGFFAAHPRVATVLFNGAQAETSFRRLVLPGLAAPLPMLRRLPSTSPANAGQRPEVKLAAWREALSDAGIALTPA
ncbi:DNA-deoxyinosine glycosylase [Lysobacter sp. Root604]|uniref:DNA-deoxyinosine glycosylase n=1 Tax=Lysobacter sp. Root604 TaxID=1736568 RepID=UPI0006FB444D|nr:DNA-deoxyinosine glycosylase [Lysobacter sp. Root604]KRA20998.1 DNA-deoxyinosine glycosylase [Lysobacter sp. Root604]